MMTDLHSPKITNSATHVMAEKDPTAPHFENPTVKNIQQG